MLSDDFLLSDDDDTTPFVVKPMSDETAASDLQKRKQRNVKQSMMTNLPFIYFIVGAILSIACGVLYIIDNSVGFTISGIIGIIISTFGLKHFKTLINLKIEIDEFSKLNLQFHKEHNGVKHEVDRLSAANTILSDTQNRIAISNQKHRDNLVIFRGIQHNMEQFNVDSMKEAKDIMLKASNIEQKWYDELFSHQRHLLETVFDRFCASRNDFGMTETEFKQFTDELPVSYQNRFARMGTFKHLAGNNSVILLDDFANTLDVFAEMQTSDVDIEFELQPTKTKRKMHPKRSLQRRKTQYFSDKDRLSILAEIDEDEHNIDDSKYDDELLMYQSQVVITKRSNTDRISWNLSDALSRGTTLAHLLETPETPETETLTERTHPFFGGRASAYYKANTFENNDRITDRSLRYIANTALSPITVRTPRLEEMNTMDITETDFTNEQINKYMKKMYNTETPKTNK